ncbi:MULTISPECIES: signal peptidase I [unclassified Pseudodesulfovibrio]|uniref:signal peptidase I n=1 Tax=unclassified Pseudodesulfovibrio TaxID=2661612 RepID=UPI000FEC0808|nr:MULTISPECIES: signal peptidase I [unclassified Pseudodesulfovibrio]MCJ2165928.1 signal peptidase I [Pseudodesulfovibrio sp. S3-i]RWU02604.1 signal peptidase I [Pseudodesulfovibrio sp. S3]
MTQSSLKSFRDTFEAVVVALLLAFFIRAFVVQAFKIPSGSMLDTLQIGDHLLVTKFAYDMRLPSNLWLDTTDGRVLMKTGDPERGDIMVFKFPEDETKDFIKRVIGLPGETLEVRNKVVYINGQPIDEPYVRHTKADTLPIRDNFGPVVIPEGRYFMMGDNREGSYDSRWWGPVKRQKIVGKALVIYWSWASVTDIRFNRIGTMFN